MGKGGCVVGDDERAGLLWASPHKIWGKSALPLYWFSIGSDTICQSMPHIPVLGVLEIQVLGSHEFGKLCFKENYKKVLLDVQLSEHLI